MLYRIEGTSVKLVGTPPAFPAEGVDLPPWLLAVLHQADELICESAFDPATPEAFLLPPTQSLTVLSCFGEVTWLWSQLGLPGHPGRCKVWAVCSQLREALTGLSPRRIERLLAADARSRSQPVQLLEDEITRRDAVPLGEQIDRLTELINDPEATATRERAAYEAWLAGDLGASGKLLEASMEEVGRENDRLLPVLRQIILDRAQGTTAGKTLMAISVPRLGGDRSIIRLLSDEGFTVTRLL